jgi:hypothetical protein
MAAQHVQVGHTATLEATFFADGVPTDDGTPTIGITRADGTVLVPPGTATTSGGTGVRRYALAAQPEVNLLKATWTGATQTVTTWAEVVGDILYTLAAMRDVRVAGDKPFANTVTYPNSLLLDKRAEVTDDFEARTGYSFIPRFAREILNGDGSSQLVLPQIRCSKLLSVTIDGTAQQTSDFTLASSGVLAWKRGGWFSTLQRQNVVVEIAYGWDRPPAVISSAGLARTAMLLQPSLIGTVSTWTTPDGVSYSYDQAGQRFQGGGIRHYGVPAIDSVLNSPSYSALGAAFA